MSDPVYTWHTRVRYAETDAQQVTHHATYVVWLESARIEALRDMGWSYRQLEADGVLMPVVDLSIRYRRASRFDDEIHVLTTMRAVGRARVTFQSEIRCGDTTIAEGEVTVAAVNTNGRPCRLPAELQAALTG